MLFKRQSKNRAPFQNYFDLRPPRANPRADPRAKQRSENPTLNVRIPGGRPGGVVRLGID